MTNSNDDKDDDQAPRKTQRVNMPNRVYSEEDHHKVRKLLKQYFAAHTYPELQYDKHIKQKLGIKPECTTLTYDDMRNFLGKRNVKLNPCKFSILVEFLDEVYPEFSLDWDVWDTLRTSGGVLLYLSGTAWDEHPEAKPLVRDFVARMSEMGLLQGLKLWKRPPPKPDNTNHLPNT